MVQWVLVLLFPGQVNEMTGFFVWADALRYLITLMLALGVLSQTMLAILSLRRYPRNFGLILENFMESFVLFGIVVFTLMYGQMIHSFFTTLITPT